MQRDCPYITAQALVGGGRYPTKVPFRREARKLPLEWIVDSPTRAPRFSLQLPVHYRPLGGSAWSDGITENISRSGVLFRTATILEINTPIEMRVVLPIGTSPERFTEVVCTGRVLRTVGVSGADARPGLAAAITDYRLEPPERDTNREDE